MRAMAIALVFAACGGGAVPEGQPSAALTTPLVDGCETNLDAGVVCDPCPGSPGQRQFDVENEGEGIPLPDGGFLVAFRQCDCAPKVGEVCGLDSTGVFHTCAQGLIWRSCPPIPAGFGGTYPATTCAEIQREFTAACR